GTATRSCSALARPLPRLFDERLPHELGHCRISKKIEREALHSLVHDPLPPHQVVVVLESKCRSMSHIWKPLRAGRGGLRPALASHRRRRWIDIRAVAKRFQDDCLKVLVENERVSNDRLDIVRWEPQIHES